MTVVEKLENRRSKRIKEVEKSHKVLYGQYLTPKEIACYMARLLWLYGPKNKNIRLLDPGAGLGTLASAFIEEAVKHDKTKIELDLYEIDRTLIGELEKLSTALEKQYEVKCKINDDDFIKCGTYEIQWCVNNTYSHIIMNPPYKKLNVNSASSRSLKEIGIEVVNLYSAFLALAIKMLQKDGVVVAIVPRSFCNGTYYLPFRKYILANCAIVHIHSFVSRVDAFEDESVLQENIIIVLKKEARQQSKVKISSSFGRDFIDVIEKNVDYSKIVDNNDLQKYFAIPSNNEEVELFTFKTTLKDLGVDVSTGPIVDFRMKDRLVKDVARDSIPLLYPIHFRNNAFTWPVESKKPNSILLHADEKTRIAFKKGNYVIVKRFSSKEEKRRVWASFVSDTTIESDYFSVENHLNIIHSSKNGINKCLAAGLFVYLNTKYVDGVFRKFSGHTQVNATDLRNMKYPNIDQLKKMGSWYLQHNESDYDFILERIVKEDAE